MDVSKQVVSAGAAHMCGMLHFHQDILCLVRAVGGNYPEGDSLDLGVYYRHIHCNCGFRNRKAAYF